MIGQSLDLLQNMRANTSEKWLENRVNKYGPMSKLSLFGKPTVFVYGQAANKFVFSSDSNTLSNCQIESVKMLLGDQCLLELSGEDHKRVRDALMSFLKPESLKQYVGKIDEEVRLHIQNYWHGKQEVNVLPLMKTLTFNIISSLLFGIERGIRREKLIDWFQEMITGMWSIPINLSFTRYNRSIRASANVRSTLKDLISETKTELEKNGANPRQDLISCLVSEQNNGLAVTEKEIIDNVILVMTAGHDTSSVVLTFLVQLFANDPSVYAAVIQEQEEIAKSKSSSECLTWEDLAKMKYTWIVALETMRLYPPIFGGFRKTVRDVEYDGYLIPKGWQVFWVTSMTQMEETIFKNPQKFDPARFDNPSLIPPYCYVHYCYVPFGGGPQICPGYEFARIETLVTIHYLVTQFTWKLNDNGHFFSRDPMPVPTEGLPIRISPKK